MISTDVLGARIAERLSNVKPVSPGVIRGERTDAGGRPYAIYYFALSNDLKNWAEHLEELQDEIIGPSYFETAGDLRWNHYLYLLASKEAAPGDSYNELKRAIEGDKSYARKFVLTEDELPTALESLETFQGEQQSVSGPDVVGRWTQRLLNAGLTVVLEQRPIAETVREISKGPVGEQLLTNDRERAPRHAQPLATKFLDAIDLVRFRQWPENRLFESLGLVNLIVGSNGTGKTTLLEAIEFFYCQENARTSSPPGAHVKAKLKGITTWQETRSTAKAAEARQRNLDWYGQRDLKGSTLPNSFSRFNFLSTDAAPMLGQKNADVSFDNFLARLVAGPKAAELWDHISRLGQPLVAERSRLRTIIAEATQSKAALETLIKTAAAAPRASDSDLSALAEDLSRLHWADGISRESVASKTVPALTRASSLARELMNAKLGLERVSRDAILAARNAVDGAFSEVETTLRQLSELDIAVRTAAVSRNALEQQIQKIGAIKSAQQMNAFGLVTDLESLRKEISELRPVIAGEDLPGEVPPWMADLNEPLTEAEASAQRQCTAFLAQIKDLDSRLAVIRKNQTSTSSVLAEIRALGRQLLTHSPDHTSCPICATAFSLGELAQRLEQAGSVTSTDHAGPILNALLIAREQYLLAESRRRVLTNLEAYANRRGHENPNAFPQDVLVDYNIRRERLEHLQGRNADVSLRFLGLIASDLGYDPVKATLQRGSRSGIDITREEAAEREIANKIVEIKALRESAISLGIDVTNQDAADDALARTLGEIKELETKLNQLAIDQRTLTQKVCLAIRGVDEVAEPIEDVVKAFRDRRTQLHNAVALVDELQQSLALEGNSEVGSIAPLLESAKASAERFAKALESESLSTANELTAKERLSQVGSRILDHEAAAERVRHAIHVLSELESEDSLLAATNAELLSVQVATDAVFRRIHSPREYGVRRDTRSPLFRLDDPSQTKTLSDVSTGQRAAFVLSVFLAMNAKLQTAPPLLLFDDPVAHIDDFNSLSFLDHLRDVALRGKRQIFYATADSRLAGLFEHKFAFLGGEFRRLDLRR